MFIVMFMKWFIKLWNLISQSSKTGFFYGVYFCDWFLPEKNTWNLILRSQKYFPQ